MFIFASRDSMQPSTAPTSTSTPRRNTNRYTRSSTTSVTQLLSDSCSSLLQRLTNRVRGPSTTSERNLYTTPNITSTSALPASTTAAASSLSTPGTPRHNHHHHSSRHHRDDTSIIGSARSRLEEKYSAILERKPSFLSSSRLNLRQRDREREASPFVREERTLEPSSRRSILKSPSTILLSEKAYPYVSPVRREKTPCHERRAHRPRRNAEGRASGYNTKFDLHEY